MSANQLLVKCFQCLVICLLTLRVWISLFVARRHLQRVHWPNSRVSLRRPPENYAPGFQLFVKCHRLEVELGLEKRGDLVPPTNKAKGSICKIPNLFCRDGPLIHPGGRIVGQAGGHQRNDIANCVRCGAGEGRRNGCDNRPSDSTPHESTGFAHRVQSLLEVKVSRGAPAD